MFVKRENVTCYGWNDQALRRLMVAELKTEHGIVIEPSQLSRMKIEGCPDIAQFVYMVTEKVES